MFALQTAEVPFSVPFSVVFSCSCFVDRPRRITLKQDKTRGSRFLLIKIGGDLWQRRKTPMAMPRPLALLNSLLLLSAAAVLGQTPPPPPRSLPMSEGKSLFARGNGGGAAKSQSCFVGGGTTNNSPTHLRKQDLYGFL